MNGSLVVCYSVCIVVLSLLIDMTSLLIAHNTEFLPPLASSCPVKCYLVLVHSVSSLAKQLQDVAQFSIASSTTVSFTV